MPITVGTTLEKIADAKGFEVEIDGLNSDSVTARGDHGGKVLGGKVERIVSYVYI